MKAELITVGTEILMGQIVNTNGAYLSQGLNELGFDLYYETVVGDNEKRLLEVLQLAQSRSELIILTGGLGPTVDDLTKQTVAKFLNRSLVEDTVAMEKIETFFKKLGRLCTPNNRLQALYLKGGLSLKNSTGLAVGSFVSDKKNHYLLLPGPPSELIPMFQKEAKPLLEKLLPQNLHLYSETLRFYGIGESQLVTILKDLIENQTNPTLAPYAKENEVTLRITAQTKTPKEGQEKVVKMKAEVLNLVGDYYYGSGEDNSLPKELVKRLKEKKLTITAAESYTAGLFQSTLGEISGVSEVFLGGFVTYASEVKHHLLGIPEEEIAKNGVVSSQIAKLMAKNAQELLKADIGVSFTGAAGPTPLEGHLPGSVYLGIAKKGQPTESYFYQLPEDRNKVRRHSVKEMCWLLLKNL